MCNYLIITRIVLQLATDTLRAIQDSNKGLKCIDKEQGMEGYNWEDKVWIQIQKGPE